MPLDWRLPVWACESIADIDFQMLRSNGIEHVVVDLDGTLAPAFSHKLHQPSIAALQAARDNGLVKDVCILSNVGIKLLLRRLQKIAASLGFKCWGCHKPNPLKPDPTAFHEALILMPDATVSNTVMIGDQMGTDMVGANRIGMRTILVRSIPPIPPWKWWKFRKQEQLLRASGIKFIKRVNLPVRWSAKDELFVLACLLLLIIVLSFEWIGQFFTGKPDPTRGEW